MLGGVKVDKLSISFEPELGDAVRSAAAQAGKPVSAWLAEAAAGKLRADALSAFLAAWEAEHGALTAAEIARAERELGLGGAGDTAA
jgi:hypothetical protein